jgi:hypothetical protein
MKLSLEKVICIACWIAFAACLIYAGATRSRNGLLFAAFCLVPIADMILLDGVIPHRNAQSPGCARTFLKILGLVVVAVSLILIYRVLA